MGDMSTYCRYVLDRKKKRYRPTASATVLKTTSFSGHKRVLEHFLIILSKTWVP